jgi:predicted glycoside hydrolase/deacetylase ChbG (UPF0249 family)
MKIVSDDFGLSPAANSVVIQAIERKILWGASVMVSMPGTQEALSYLTKHPKVTHYGLHLNLTEGRPLSNPKSIPTLVNQQGQFLGWGGLVKASLLGHIDLDHIALETRVQLNKLSLKQKPIDFLNSHHHVHLWPAFVPIITPLIKEYGIAQVRSPQTTWWPGLLKRHGLKSIVIQSIGKVRTYPTREIAPYVIDIDWAGANGAKRQKLIETLPSPTELICHPLVFDGSHGPSTLEWLIRKEKKDART